MRPARRRWLGLGGVGLFLVITLAWGLSLSYRVAFVSPTVAIALEKHHLFLRFWRVTSVPRTTVVLEP